MRSRVRALVVALAVATGGLAVGAPAGAVGGSFDATCRTSGGPNGPITSHRTLTWAAHAPDSVAPGADVVVQTEVGYAVPPNASAGVAAYAAPGATDFQQSAIAGPGDPSIQGPVSFRAPAEPGGAVPVLLTSFGAVGQVGDVAFSEVCQPDHTLVVARVGVGVPLVSIGDAAVVEGSSGTRALQFAVSLSRPSPTPVTIAFATEDGTATAGSDYAAQSGTVTVPAGFVSLGAAITLRVRGDRTVEPKENLRVRLHDPVGAALGRAVGTGRIIDDDPEPGARISIGDASVVEGARAVRSARFVVSLSEPATQQVLFHYRTVDGSAVAGSDYESQDSEFSIAAGKSSITVPVPVVPDAVSETNETFTVQLVGATGAVIGRAKGVGTIIDDD